MRIQSRVKRRRRRVSLDVHPARVNRVLNVTKLSASMRRFSRAALARTTRATRVKSATTRTVVRDSREETEPTERAAWRERERERDDEDVEDGETKWVRDFHRREDDDAGP